MSKRAVLYARVSGDDRQNSTSSLEGQLDLCREYAAQQGWEIIAELSEDERGASGAIWDLPQLNQALELAKAGEFDVLVARELDRLARKLAKQLVMEVEFNRSGVKIEYVLGNYQDTPEGQLNKQIRAVIAEYEREKINERMVRGRRRKAQTGYVVVHGNPPYGYKVQKDDNGVKLVIDDETAEIVRMIFEWYIVKAWGTPTITKALNRLGIPAPSVAKNTKTPKSIGWNQSQVARTLQNETYAGKWRYGKRNLQGKHPQSYHIVVNVPAIISREVFDQAQEQRRSNTILSKRNTKLNYLLAKRCLCGECQAHMVALTKKVRNSVYSYYRCPVHHLQGTHYLYRQCNMTTNFRADYWDKAVWQEIREFLANPSKLAKGIDQYRQEQEKVNEPLQKRVVTIDGLLGQKRQELNRLLDLYLTGEFGKDALLERKQRLEGIIAALEEERDNFLAQMKKMLTYEQILELKAFAEQIAEGLFEADEDFETRKRMLDYLGVKVTLSVEDGKQTAMVYCQFGHNKRLTKTTEKPSRQPQLAHLTSSHEEEGDSCMPIGRRSTGYSSN